MESVKKTRWQLYKEKNGVTPLELLNPNKKIAEVEISNDRFEICKQCIELIPIVNQCKQCGCFMPLKTKLEEARCPLGKW